MNALRKEWGAVTFVVTVLIGAVAVAISLIISGSHAPPPPPLPTCPLYTPYVTTSTPSASSTLAATPSPTAFNPALANCPTAPLPPTTKPTPTPKPGTTPTPVPTPVPTNPVPTPLPS